MERLSGETQITISKFYPWVEEVKSLVYKFDVPESYVGRLASDIYLEIAQAIFGQDVLALFEVNDNIRWMTPKQAETILRVYSEKIQSQYPG